MLALLTFLPFPPPPQQLRFAIYDWDHDCSDETYDQDDLGTMECTVAELIRAHGNKVFGEIYLNIFMSI